MRIVLLNQFYPPDVAPTGHYLRDLAVELVRQGHEVAVVASRHAYAGGGEYPAHQWIDGVEVVRLSGLAFGRGSYAGKLADYAAYYARLSLDLLRRRKCDLIASLTTPPFLGLLAKTMADLSGAAHAHWVMDVYPDVLQAHGMVRGPALQALRVLARRAYAGARSIVTLGPAMAERVREYAPAGTPVHWAPLWSPETLAPWPDGKRVPLRAERGWEPDRLVLLYSGNFGLGHRFEEFLQAAQQLGDSGPRWVFAGSGRSRTAVERFAASHPHLPIELLPYTPEARLREHLCSADVHLVSMDSRWEGTLLPSKLQASFAVGKPVLFVGSGSGDLAHWIEAAGAGWVVAEGEASGVIRAVAHAGKPGELQTRGRAAWLHAQAHFARDACVRDLIAKLLT